MPKNPTDRRVKKQVAELEASRLTPWADDEQFRRAIEDAPIPTIVHAEDGQVLQISRSWTELTGYALPDVPTLDAWLNLAYGEGADVVRDHVHELFKGTRKTIDVELPVVGRDGTLRYWSFSASSPGALLDGRRFVVGMAVDITDKRRAEEALQQVNTDLDLKVQERTRELSQAVQALQEQSERLRAMAVHLTFSEQRERQRLAQILHDGLQQFLVAAKYHTSVAARSEDVQDALDVVTELIDQAIEISRTLTAELNPPDLLKGDLVAALRWLIRWMFDKHALAIDLVVHRTIPTLDQQALLVLFQAIRELSFNVAKHAGVSKASVEVNLLDGRIELTIKDEGKGFDPNLLHGGSGKPKGFGLLSIIERLTYIGGEIGIDSAPGRGSRFRLTVPLSTALAESGLLETQARGSRATSHKRDAAPTQEIVRVVLVEGHILVRQGLIGIINAERDMKVIGEASDDKSGVDMLLRLRPDIVLMDIDVCGVNGIETIQTIRREVPAVRVIGLLMSPEPAPISLVQEAGAAGFFVKGDPPADLIKTIRNCSRPRIS